jgi:hypothetical protein
MFTRAALVLLIGVTGCTANNHVGVGKAGPQQPGPTAPTPKASTDDSCQSSTDLVGCPCDTVGASHACGACGDGQQVCNLYGEFQLWSSCDGASTMCSPGSNMPGTPSVGTGSNVPSSNPGGSNPNGNGNPPVGTGTSGNPGVGTGTGGPSPSPSSGPSPSPTPPPCTTECNPGTTRWCDDPVYCNWGQQTCGPDGFWGTCVEVSTMPAGCDGPSYDAACCLAQNQCCQGWDDVKGVYVSAGNCAAQLPYCQ